MVAYNFQKQFESKILDGSKKHTIRRWSKRRQARRGEMLQLYFGMRTKYCRKILDDIPCFNAMKIEIVIDEDAIFQSIKIDECFLSPVHWEQFSIEDGFDSLLQFEQFFFDQHGPGLFQGQLTVWDPSSMFAGWLLVRSQAVFDKAINKIRHHFGIHSADDWRDVKPEWIIKMDGIGPATLDHIRLYLAARNITLCEDETPEYWNKRLSESRIAKTLSYDDCKIQVPFTVLIDSMEQQPFGFEDIAADVSETPGDLKKMVSTKEIDQSDVKLIVPIKFKALGVANGDYSIEGYMGHANVERKSMDDAHGTFLGWGDRRTRFENELESLAAMDCAAVVVECSLGQLLAEAPSRGKKSASENRKILHRQVLSWQQQFRVPWIFCDSRRLAEITTFRILQRFWKKQMQTKTPSVISMEQIQMELAEL